MARISVRLPSSWATEINFQSRYPGGISVTKTGELSFLCVFAPAASEAMALGFSVVGRAAFCACAFCLMTTAEMVKDAATMIVIKWFLIFSYFLFDVIRHGAMREFGTKWLKAAFGLHSGRRGPHELPTGSCLRD